MMSAQRSMPGKYIKWFRLTQLLLIIGSLFLGSCKKTQRPDEEPAPEPAKKDTLAIYTPQEFKNSDFTNPASKWAYKRSRQSEHFIVFWDAKYGANDPNAAAVPEQYRVDINDLLLKAEGFYELNINTLKFAEVGKGKSNLDKYKMMIFLHYQDDWLATGSGYDDVIGALWISPGTVKPVGSTLAHEIGHCFQYQVRCDKGGSYGFRYGFGGKPGNGFWEQTAQWQAFQSYPEEAFSSYNFGVYMDNCHRHFHHESQRYASYFLQTYWASKHGIDIVGRIWHEALQPEDGIQAYMRLTGINNKQLNDEIYDAAARFATWDVDAIREMGAGYIGQQPYEFDKLSDGSFQVKYSRCPGTTGFNIVPVKVPAGATAVKAMFTGLANANGYNHVDETKAGWRYGFVALLTNGTRVYGTIFESKSGEATFNVPANCSKLWFIVTGAPTAYVQHAWDDDNSNDEQWPYKVKFTNTTLLNDIEIVPGSTPKDVTFNIDVTVPYDTENYSRSTITADLEKLAQSFVLTPAQITQGLANKTIKFYAVESNGTLNAQTTANGYGHWFNAAGNVIGWGADARVFSEMNAEKFTFDIGQFPKQVALNDKFNISQALVYEYAAGKTVTATFKFAVTVK